MRYMMIELHILYLRIMIVDTERQLTIKIKISEFQYESLDF